MSYVADGQRTASTDPAFVALARSWMQDPARQLLGFIWQAYENMSVLPPHVDTKDLERSITQLLEPRVRDVMTGDEPFYIQHGPYERETKPNRLSHHQRNVPAGKSYPAKFGCYHIILEYPDLSRSN